MTTNDSSGSELPDKRRVSPDDKRPVRFVLREPGFLPDFDKVTSVAGVTFNDERQMVTAFEHGGPDFPGGHVRTDETDPEQTLRRESREEAGIGISKPTHVRAIEVQPEGADPEEYTYMLIMAAMVTEYGDVPPGSKRVVISVTNFKATYSGLDQEMVGTLIDEAFALIFGEGD